MAKLTDEQITMRLSGLNGWQVVDGQLTKTFDFNTYLAGLEFGTDIGYAAEKMDHHPDLLITWRKVKVSVSTHSEGGITEKDFALAEACEKRA